MLVIKVPSVVKILAALGPLYSRTIAAITPARFFFRSAIREVMAEIFTLSTAASL